MTFGLETISRRPRDQERECVPPTTRHPPRQATRSAFFSTPRRERTGAAQTGRRPRTSASMSVEAYRQAVCTRVIALLSPPTNEDLVGRFALVAPATPAAVAPPLPPERVLIPLRVLSWEACVALIVVGVAIGLALRHAAGSAGGTSGSAA